MSTYIIDTEVQMGNTRHPRFARRATKMLCIAFKKVGGERTYLAHTPEQIEKALDLLLADGNTLIAHNAPFDAEAIYHLCKRPVRVKLIDTLSLARTVRKDIGMIDYEDNGTYNHIPDELVGSQSLKAWAIRLGDERKDSEESFGEDFDWVNAEYTPEMGEYCKQDVDLLETFYNHLMELAETNPTHDDPLGRPQTISSTMKYWYERHANDGGYRNDIEGVTSPEDFK